MAGSDQLRKLLAQATTINQLGLPPSLAVDLVYRILFSEGDVNVARLADVTKLFPQVIDEIMSDMQHDHMVEVVKAGTLRMSYTYRLTDEGAARARDALERTQYIGPFPVDIDAYRNAILLQTANQQKTNPAEVKQALSHLILPDSFHRRIGPAMNSATSLFLYGPPGNGKTTVAQAIAKLLAGADPIWLPYAVSIGGQIIQIHDPLVHIPYTDPSNYDAPTGKTGFIGVDKRWSLYQRPSVMVGGELTMDTLELRFEPIAKIYEAPLQMKANGGMFLIDDFGRQQMSPQQLLNRWIVPLETRIDYLRMQSGQTLEIPFKQLNRLRHQSRSQRSRRRGVLAPHSDESGSDQPRRENVLSNLLANVPEPARAVRSQRVPLPAAKVVSRAGARPASGSSARHSQNGDCHL